MIFPLIFVILISSPLVGELMGGSGRLETNSNPETLYFTADVNYPKAVSEWVGRNAALTEYARSVDDLLWSPLQKKPDDYELSDRVLSTSSGKLFIVDQFQESCSPHASVDEIGQTLDGFLRELNSHGITTYVAISPNKSTLNWESVPSSYPLYRCAISFNQDFWDAVLDVDGVIDLVQPLVTFESEFSISSFKNRDTHWNQGGAATAVTTILNKLDDEETLPDLELYLERIIDYEGDLDGLNGVPPIVDQTVSFSIRNTPVVESTTEVVEENSYDGNRRISNMSAMPLLGKIVVFGDSFTEVAEPFLAPFFEEITFYRLYDFDVVKYAELISDADYVLFWSVERSFTWRLTNQWVDLPSVVLESN